MAFSEVLVVIGAVALTVIILHLMLKSTVNKPIERMRNRLDVHSALITELLKKNGYTEEQIKNLKKRK